MTKNDFTGDELLIPVGIAELLHVVLGPLAEVLKDEGHPWAEIAARVVERYVNERDALLKFVHGSGAAQDIAYYTISAVDKVCSLSDSVLREAEDFVKWSYEIGVDPDPV